MGSFGEEVNGGFLCRGGRWCVQKARRSTVGFCVEEVGGVFRRRGQRWVPMARKLKACSKAFLNVKCRGGVRVRRCRVAGVVTQRRAV